MKKLIVTMASHKAGQEYGKITFPLMQAYAYRCGADFLVYQNMSGRWKHTGYEKWEYIKYLDCYDRILHIDSDMVVKGGTPDLFNLVPLHCFAGVDENEFESPTQEYPYVNRYEELEAMGVENPRFYINVGLYLFSRQHKQLFDDCIERKDGFFEQTHLNIRLHHANTPIHLLSWHYNYMSIMENSGLQKKFAHIIHYAGAWRGYNTETVCRMMREDTQYERP